MTILQYNMPSECCDDYINLYNFIGKRSAWCFTFFHISTYELIPSDLGCQELGHNWWTIRLSPTRG